MRRCLVLELLPYHEEILPHWLGLLAQLGYSADVYARGDVHEKSVLAPCGLRSYRLFDLEELLANGRRYDFVLLNTLLGSGFDDAVGAPFRPMLRFLAGLGLPSISVVHEPILWGERYPEMMFDEHRGGGVNDLFLYRDGTLDRDNVPWSPNDWSLQGGELRLRWGEKTDVLRSRDGGLTFGGDGHRLVLRRFPGPTLGEHLDSASNLLLTLSRHGAQYLGPYCGDVRWVHPVYFGDFPEPPRRERRIALPGMIDYERKSFDSLFAAAAEIRRLELPIYVVGGERDAARFETSPNVRRLREDLERHGLSDRVLLTGPLSYPGYLDFVRQSAFVLPLVDDEVEIGSYRTKLSTAVALGIAFGVPLILNERIAELYGLEEAIRYPGADLAAGLRAVPAGGWDVMRRELVAKREELAVHNRRALRRALEKMVTYSANRIW